MTSISFGPLKHDVCDECFADFQEINEALESTTWHITRRTLSTLASKNQLPPVESHSIEGQSEGNFRLTCACGGGAQIRTWKNATFAHVDFLCPSEV